MYKNFGEYYTQEPGKGSCQTIYVGSSPRQTRMAVLIPAEAWNGTDTRGTHLARYGFIDEGLKGDGNDPSQAGIDRALFAAGPLVEHIGDLTVQGQLQGLVNAPGNPFKLELWPTYAVTIQDAHDTLLIKDAHQADAVYNTVIVPMLSGGVGIGTDAATTETTTAKVGTGATAAVTQPDISLSPTVATQATADKYLGTVWGGGLRAKIRSDHGITAPTIREDIFSAFRPLVELAVETGLIDDAGGLVQDDGA